MTQVQTRGEIITFIEQVFGAAKLSNGGLNASVLCPVCEQEGETSKKKLVIRTDDFRCHCWVCGFKGRTIIRLLQLYNPDFLKPFIEKFGNLFVLDAERDLVVNFREAVQHLLDQDDCGTLVEPSEVKIPDGFLLLADYNHQTLTKGSIHNARNYLYSRGLTQDDLWYYKFGISSKDHQYFNRVIIPSHDALGELNFYTSRALNMWQRPKYFSPTLPREGVIFNELNINWNKELTIVEGPFDMVKCGDNATCLLGSELNEHYLLFKKIIEHNTPVILALDNDAKKKSFNILHLLLEYELDSVRLLTPPTHVNDVGELTKQEVKYLQEKARTVSTSDFFRLKLELLTA